MPCLFQKLRAKEDAKKDGNWKWYLLQSLKNIKFAYTASNVFIGLQHETHFWYETVDALVDPVFGPKETDNLLEILLT